MNIRASAHPRKSASCLGCVSDAQPSAPGLCVVNAFMTACILFAFGPEQIKVYVGSLCDEHRAIAARTLPITAEKNGVTVDELTKRLERIFGIPAGFTCPRCGKTSANPNDLANGYCGACHDWTAAPGGQA
jgi:hypothetical protein